MEIKELDKFIEKNSFSKHQRSINWNRDAIGKLITELAKTTKKGNIRVIPLDWIYKNLRLNEKLIVWSGWSARELFIRVAKELKIDIEVHAVNCPKNKIEGSIEILFK